MLEHTQLMLSETNDSKPNYMKIVKYFQQNMFNNFPSYKIIQDSSLNDNLRTRVGI